MPRGLLSVIRFTINRCADGGWPDEDEDEGTAGAAEEEEEDDAAIRSSCQYDMVR